MKNLCSAIGLPCNFSNRALMRGVFTLEGSIGSDWSWNTYIQSSSVRLRQRLYNNPITARFNNAIDAVVVTPQNQGASGLALGSIQCRALLNPATATGVDVAGCQPMNLFGIKMFLEPLMPLSIRARIIPPGSWITKQFTLTKLLCRHPRKACCHSDCRRVPSQLHLAVNTGSRQARQSNPDPARNGAWAAGNFASYAGQYNVEEDF